ncbi:MAG: hypothetical protein WCB90_08335 [Methanosarcina sp.]
MDLNTIIEQNFTIIIGIFVTLIVMGITTLYDTYKSKDGIKDKTSFQAREVKPSRDSDKKTESFSSKKTKGFSEFSKKLSSLLPKKVRKNNFENTGMKSPKTGKGIQKIFGTLQNEVSVLSSFLRGKKGKSDNGKSGLQFDKKSGSSKLSKAGNVSGFDVDKIVESKKDELDFDDNLLTQMSTAGSIKNNDDASLNSDLTFDNSDFDIGFESMDDESSGEDLFNTGAEKIALADGHDSLLDSLKKDIVISKEAKIDFMTSMKGENLDLKLMKSDLEDILQDLKKYRKRSNHN